MMPNPCVDNQVHDLIVTKRTFRICHHYGFVHQPPIIHQTNELFKSRVVLASLMYWRAQLPSIFQDLLPDVDLFTHTQEEQGGPPKRSPPGRICNTNRRMLIHPVLSEIVTRLHRQWVKRWGNPFLHVLRCTSLKIDMCMQIIYNSMHLWYII